jgi:Domain of unknown function (DUF5753)
MSRQRVLDAEIPLRLSVVLDESVLRRAAGGAEVMRDQLRHLVQAANRPNVDLRATAWPRRWSRPPSPSPGTATIWSRSAGP